MAEFVIRPGREGQIAGVDPVLRTILETAARIAPPTISRVEAFSGKAGRATGTRNHPSGRAIDVQLYDANGRALDRYLGNPFGVKSKSEIADYQVNEQFAQTARAVQRRDYPELSDRFRWGGYFGGGVNPGDSMHFDLSGGLSKGTPPQTERWINGFGNGVSLGQEALYAVYSPAPDNALSRLLTSVIGAGQQPPAPASPLESLAADPETDLLARTMLAEARGEGIDGMAAVGWVAQNRANDPSGKWPGTITEVLQQPNQFAAPLDRSQVTEGQYNIALQVASNIKSKALPDPTKGATFFWNPDTASKAATAPIAAAEPFRAKIGRHDFYGGEEVVPASYTPQVSAEPSPRLNPRRGLDAFATRPDRMLTAPAPQPLNLTADAGAKQGASATGTLPLLPPTPPMRPPASLAVSASAGHAPGMSVEQVNPFRMASGGPRITGASDVFNVFGGGLPSDIVLPQSRTGSETGLGGSRSGFNDLGAEVATGLTYAPRFGEAATGDTRSPAINVFGSTEPAAPVYSGFTVAAPQKTETPAANQVYSGFTAPPAPKAEPAATAIEETASGLSDFGKIMAPLVEAGDPYSAIKGSLGAVSDALSAFGVKLPEDQPPVETPIEVNAPVLRKPAATPPAKKAAMPSPGVVRKPAAAARVNPMAVSLPQLGVISGIQGPGNYPMSPGGVSAWVRSQPWQAPNFTPGGGGGRYPYFANTTSGFGGYATPSGNVFSYRIGNGYQTPGSSGYVPPAGGYNPSRIFG